MTGQKIAEALQDADVTATCEPLAGFMVIRSHAFRFFSVCEHRTVMWWCDCFEMPTPLLLGSYLLHAQSKTLPLSLNPASMQQDEEEAIIFVTCVSQDLTTMGTIESRSNKAVRKTNADGLMSVAA